MKRAYSGCAVLLTLKSIFEYPKAVIAIKVFFVRLVR
jgi:hypothetical protein